MKKSFLVEIIIILFLTILFDACRRDINSIIPNAVSVRFYNNSPFKLENVEIENVDFGSINAFSFSEYQEVRKANKYSFVRLELDGLKYAWYPNDYLDDPFPEGQYLFFISVHKESRQLHISILYDDNLPSYRQPDSSTQTIMAWEWHIPSSIVSHSPNMFDILALKQTRTFFNPTLATKADSKLLYLPDAFVTFTKFENIIIQISNSGEIHQIRTVGPKLADLYRYTFDFGRKKILSDCNNNILICGDDYILDEEKFTLPRIIWWQKLDNGLDSVFIKMTSQDLPAYFSCCDIDSYDDKKYLISGSLDGKGYLFSIDGYGEILKDQTFQETTSISSCNKFLENAYVISTKHSIKRLNSDFSVVWSADYSNIKQILKLDDDTFLTLQDSTICKWNFDTGSILSSFSFTNKYEKLLWMCKTDSTHFVVSSKTDGSLYCTFMIDSKGNVKWEKKTTIPIYSEDLMSCPLISVNNSTFHMINSDEEAWLLEINNYGEIVQSNSIIKLRP